MFLCFQSAFNTAWTYEDSEDGIDEEDEDEDGIDEEDLEEVEDEEVVTGANRFPLRRSQVTF